MKLKRRRFGIYSLAALAMILLLNIGCEKERLFEPEPELKSGSAERNEGNKYLIGFHATPDVNLVRGFGGDVTRTFTIVPAVAANLPQQAIEALQKNPKIRYIEPDYEVFATSQTVPWGINRIFRNETYSFSTWSTTKGSGISVAILDTGIDTDHQDLPSVAGGTNTVGGTSYEDGNGHGTHVAGTVAARDNTLGVVGVAPAISLYAVKVLDDGGSGSVSSVVAGIEWAVNQDINVLNMSLGSSSSSETLKSACDAAYNSGHLVVSSAGNSGNPGGKGNKVGYPAAYESVIAVAASTSSDKRASYSSTGPAVELIAPGSSILSTLPDNNYGTYSGTSMASPHVAGVAALAWAANTTLSNVEVRMILRETAEDLGLSAEHQGYGLARADLAVAAASGGTTPTNNPPVADAGPDKTVTDSDGSGDESVTLDGSASIDPDGDNLTFSWSLDGNKIGTGETYLHTFAIGSHTVTLTVSDGEFTDSDDVIITVSESTGNDAPTIDNVTITDNSNPAWTRVAVNWSVSDANNDLQSVKTELFDPSGNFVDTASTTISGSSASSTDELGQKGGPSGNYSVKVTVTDVAGNTKSESYIKEL